MEARIAAAMAAEEGVGEDDGRGGAGCLTFATTLETTGA